MPIQLPCFSTPYVLTFIFEYLQGTCSVLADQIFFELAAQHQSKVTEGSAAIPVTAQLQINSELSKANAKRKNISAQQAQAKRPALDTRRPDHLLCAAARRNV